MSPSESPRADAADLSQEMARLRQAYRTASKEAAPQWEANHIYTSHAVIIGPDEHMWSANLGGGKSGRSIPYFALNWGGSVLDNTIEWTDHGHVESTFEYQERRFLTTVAGLVAVVLLVFGVWFGFMASSHGRSMRSAR